MKTIIDESWVPPGGWYFDEPRTKQRIRAGSFSMLIGNTRKFLADNNLDIPANINEIVLDQFCERIPERCQSTDPPTPAQMAKSFAKSILTWINQGMRVVSQEEFEKRRTICLSCQMWRGEAAFGLGRCGKCGCVVVKLSIATEHCPLNKWSAV